MQGAAPITKPKKTERYEYLMKGGEKLEKVEFEKDSGFLGGCRFEF